MKEKRVTGFRTCSIAPACRVLVCMTAIAFLTAAFALQGIVESSVEGVASMESVQGQEPPSVPRSGDALGLPEKPRVEDSFFDKTLFVGDSITIKLE